MKTINVNLIFTGNFLEVSQFMFRAYGMTMQQNPGIIMGNYTKVWEFYRDGIKQEHFKCFQYGEKFKVTIEQTN